MTALLVLFATVCVCVVVSVATLGTAESADIADGKGGFGFTRTDKVATVLHNAHRQVCVSVDIALLVVTLRAVESSHCPMALCMIQSQIKPMPVTCPK